jgi:DNA-binding MarR family transcriptional regulator
MNDEMPWVNLTQKEVDELRKQKHTLTEYGKEKLRKMMNNYIPDDDVIEEMVNVKLTEEKKEELERLRRRETVLSRYNHFYNDECSGMPHGTPITPEHMQALALECMIDALICENMNVEYNAIAIDDIKDLIARLYQQGNDYLKRVQERVQEFKDSADGVA